jgi:small subunit ribosomal protein S16|tara:strand:+ start:1254 stop:1685 length:432 start_codon:yes stop_codon:yes gene_type:complete
MAVKIRLARRGRKNRPFYSIVACDSRMPRDGRYIEKLGTYNPLLAKDDEKRVTLNEERIKYWLGEGAQTSFRVATFLGKAGLADMPDARQSIAKAQPKAKEQARLEAKAEKAKLAAEAAAEAAAAPAVEEAPAEEAAAEETAA